MTERLNAGADGLLRAAALLAAGGLVAFPTETVYGLGANASDGAAVARIFAAKRRPRFNPLIVHIHDLDAARRIAGFGTAAERLAGAFWPGPMTLVLPLRPDAGIAGLATAGLDSIGIRIPDAALARELLGRCGTPVAAPSANLSGEVSPTTADHVLAGLSGRIDAVLDGGPCSVGVESTILDATTETVTLLRPGGLPLESVEDCLGGPVHTERGVGPPTAPGQLESHYAPRAALRLNAESAGPDEAFLGFGAIEADLNLSRGGDLTEAAANLFAFLRRLDRTAPRIAVARIPDHGLGRAINDRLRRAAAPRPEGA